MATYAQRAQGIANAIVNGTATLAQIDRIGTAIAANQARAEEYAALTSAGRAEFLVRYFRDTTLAIVRAADMQAAMATAQSSAASDLPEAP